MENDKIMNVNYLMMKGRKQAWHDFPWSQGFVLCKREKFHIVFNPGLATLHSSIHYLILFMFMYSFLLQSVCFLSAVQTALSYKLYSLLFINYLNISVHYDTMILISLLLPCLTTSNIMNSKGNFVAYRIDGNCNMLQF